MEDVFWNRGGGYGIFLQEWEGNFKLAAGKRNDDKDWLDWGWPAEWSKNERKWVPADKKRPVGVYFGDKRAAIQALERFLAVLKGSPTLEPESADSDISF